MSWVRGLRLPDPATRLGACHFRAVSRVFHACYAWQMPRSQARNGPATRACRGRDTVDGVSASQVGGAKAPDGHSDYDYAGERFGLPEHGPRSVASIGRRLVALLIDWLVCLLIARAAFRSQYWQYWTLAIFAVQDYLLTALTGLTLGKRLAGIRVARLDGKTFAFGRTLVRTLLLLLVVPPLVTDLDMRGLHDRAANTIVIRL